jgi:hypothetical protein
MSRLADHHIEDLQLDAQRSYDTHNEDEDIITETHGTWRVGLVGATYDNLVTAFGEPLESEDIGINFEWCIKFGDGTIATVYDYNMAAPCYDAMDWHVGGKDGHAATLVATAVLRAV